MHAHTHQSRVKSVVSKLVYRAFAVGLAVLSAVALVGLSGVIVFADLKTPGGAELAGRTIQTGNPLSAVEQ